MYLCREFYKVKLTQYNDPIYGFITIPTPFIGKLINHPYVQRLRRIKQMGLSFLVFPSTEHTRFQHALGAMHLATKAVASLRKQGVEINDNEAEALYAALLLHDLGHGPFSHALEHALLPDTPHEKMSLALMRDMNREFEGKLDLTIEMFTNSYSRGFFNQLISSHIDLDRLDYLKRDSFYSGVTEGNINSERLITMMTVKDDMLVFFTKAIHSIEKFLLARRMMYWSVYLHKTSFVAEELLIRFFKRFDQLENTVKTSLGTAAVAGLANNKTAALEDKIPYFVHLDDNDIWVTLKVASSCDDAVLAALAKMILNRNLLKIEIAPQHFSSQQLKEKQQFFMKKLGLSATEIDYFVFSGSLSTQGYNLDEEPIKLCSLDDELILFDASSENAHFPILTRKDYKYFLAFPKQDGYFS
jgi:HD superfamily phosphohydrolase